MVAWTAGSAALFNNYIFHGNYPNVGTYAREALQLSYRPTWAGPAGNVEPWDPDEVASISPSERAFMGDRGTRIWIYEGGNKPADLAREAPGRDPSRWGAVRIQVVRRMEIERSDANSPSWSPSHPPGPAHGVSPARSIFLRQVYVRKYVGQDLQCLIHRDIVAAGRACQKLPGLAI